MMTFLKLGTDIEFIQGSRNAATVIFEIKNMAAVDAFLNNEDLIKFLTDPATADASSCGRRLIITKAPDADRGHILTIRRQMKSQTIPYFAYADLIASLNTFVMPYELASDLSYWDDIAGIGIAELRKIRLEENHRGYEFVYRDIERANLNP